MIGNLPLYVLERKELTADADGITFTLSDYTLPTDWTGKHLVILATLRSAIAGAEDTLFITFNGSSSGYHLHYFNASNTTSSAARRDSKSSFDSSGQMPGGTATANHLGVFAALIPEYANTSRHKTMISQMGNMGNNMRTTSHLWANTAAITSIKIDATLANMEAPSAAILCLVDESYSVRAETKGSAGTFDISSIPDLDGDLMFIGMLRGANASALEDVELNLANDTTDANYDRQRLLATDTTLAAAQASDRIVGKCTGDSATANAFGAIVGSVHQYGLPDNDPAYTALSQGFDTTTPTAGLAAISGCYNAVAAIARFGLQGANTTNFVTGSSLWLYRQKPYTLREELTSTTTITIDAIPQDGVALQISICARGDNASATRSVHVYPNADETATNYRYQYHRAAASTASAARNTNDIDGPHMPGSSGTANVFGGATLVLPDYTSTNRVKMMTGHGGNAEASMQAIRIGWDSTVAVTSLKFDFDTGDMVDGTVVEVTVVKADPTATLESRAA